ncbi:MAG: chemotaxis protein CheW [Acidobacteriota bacterium]
MSLDRSMDCWNAIGVLGDRSCPALSTYVHCRNCPEMMSTGRRLLDRALPDEYRSSWADLLSKEIPRDAPFDSSVTVFRLRSEWLAISTKAFVEVLDVRPLRKIPHRTNDVFRGLVSARGEIHLCVSLSALLGLDAESPVANTMAERMCVVRLGKWSWVFAADEVAGVVRYRAAELMPPPVTVQRALPRFTAGLLESGGRKIGVLDEETVMQALHRSLG